MTQRLSFAIFSILIVGAWASLGSGPARAQDYDVGMAAYEAGDYKRAVRIWDPLATGGDATAQYSLGKLFETGNIELQRDYGRAVEWYRLAAAQGVAPAQNNLGLMYAQGRGVARDAGRSVELWSGAAKQNHPMAQFNLGLAYFRGEGVAENKKEAESWFRRAAELGLADAQYALGQVRLHGLTAKADPGEALAWYQLAAAQGHQKAREQAGVLRKEGVKPRMDATLDSPEGAPGGPSVVQPKAQIAQAPAPVTPKAPAPATTKDAAAVQVEKAPSSTAVAQPVAPAVTAKQSTAVAELPVKQGVTGTQIAAPKVAQTKATPAKSTLQTQPAAKPAVTQAAKTPPAKTQAPSPPQIKTQVARADVGATPSGAEGRVKAWLFSAESEGEAIRYLRKVEAEQGPLLTGIDSAVTPVQFSDGGVLYRVVAGNFATWNDGRTWCSLLSTRVPGTFCKVLPSPEAAN